MKSLVQTTWGSKPRKMWFYAQLDKGYFISLQVSITTRPGIRFEEIGFRAIHDCLYAIDRAVESLQEEGRIETALLATWGEKGSLEHKSLLWNRIDRFLRRSSYYFIEVQEPRRIKRPRFKLKWGRSWPSKAIGKLLPALLESAKRPEITEKKERKTA